MIIVSIQSTFLNTLFYLALTKFEKINKNQLGDSKYYVDDRKKFINFVDDFKVVDGDPRFDRRFADFNALDVANEWIKHTYNNGFSLPSMPF